MSALKNKLTNFRIWIICIIFFFFSFQYRLISNNVTTKDDQSQNLSEHNGKPILVSETFCLALTHQPKNAKIKKKAEMKTKTY